MQSRSEMRHLLTALVLGGIVFLLGFALAQWRVPDYRLGDIPPESFFLQRHRELTDRLGVRWEEEQPRLSIVNPANEVSLSLEMTDRAAPGSIAESYAQPRIRISRDAFLSAAGETRELSISYSTEGRPLSIEWQAHGWRQFYGDMSKPYLMERLFPRFASLLLAPGESARERQPVSMGGAPAFLAEIVGGSSPMHLFVIENPGGGFYMSRRPGTLEQGHEILKGFSPSRFILKAAPTLLRIGAVLLLFLVLAARSRIDLVNGAFLGGLTILISMSAALAGQWSQTELSSAFLWAAFQGVWIFLLWSAGESFLRTSDPSFTTSLDALRVWRLGPRGGRALLHGFALGAGLAGLRLLVSALVSAVPGVWLNEPVLHLPVFEVAHHPFLDGIWIAAMALIMLAIARRLFAVRWVPWATALAGALLAPPLDIQPFALGVAANFALFAILVYFAGRYGLTALLTASVTALLLPAAAFAALHLQWQPVTFAATAGTSIAFLVLGLIGLRRPDSIEAQRLVPPAFMRRLEEERRLRYEMQLLARMQEGLLPEVPDLPGWELAARSILATEAGGDLYDFLFDEDGQLWVAVGDVAGHGYSCAIVQAMTTAALTSLIRPGALPSEVLLQVDRVIRRGGSARNFASLTLLRLDPQTGEVVISNAGHPFPLLVLEGDVSEIVLPGLPLGKGPKRCYLDVTLNMPPGAALVFCSDGLIETQDWQQASYGFDRPLEVLRRDTTLPAEKVLEALLADWRRHLGSEEPPDDTTVVVVRRVG